MSTNKFSKIRKLVFTQILFGSFFPNMIIFGQALEPFFLFERSKKLESYATSDTKIEKENSNLANSRLNQRVFQKSSNEKTTFGTYVEYHAIEKQGEIGTGVNQNAEIASDNFFTVNLDSDILSKNYRVLLSYDVFGIEESEHTTKSINNNQAYGGALVVVNSEWKTVYEQLPINQLKQGSNRIFFNRRSAENYQYKVKNVKLIFQEKKTENENFTFKNYAGKIYAYGVLDDLNVSEIDISGNSIPVIDGVFEAIIDNLPETTFEVELKWTSNKLIFSKRVPVKFINKLPSLSIKANQNIEITTIDNSAVTVFEEENSENESSCLIQNSNITTSGLYFKDMRPLSPEITNVTYGNFEAYRINSKSQISITRKQLALKYDFSKIPDGYTPADIRTFYFDNELREWKSLDTDSIDYVNQRIFSTVLTNETDYINGVIKAPESPETAGFAPTAMTEMKFADPTAGVQTIAAPQPNNTGSVNTSFQLKIPNGRHGMQPSLAVTYNSEAGNGWMGIGWNLSTPAVTLNTKWGAPRFTTLQETEMYSLNGSDLVLKIGNTYTNPNRQDNIARTSNREFYNRKEGSYQKIIRRGTNPTNYFWEVTDKLGNKTFYGGITAVDTTAVIKDSAGNITHWGITRSIDTYGNYIDYTYTQQSTVLPNSSVTVKEFYIHKIKYTRHNSFNNNYYEITFNRNDYTVGDQGESMDSETRTDAIISARSGTLTIIDDLLTEVYVDFKRGNTTERIRTYRFNYDDKDLGKKQLSKISEFDSAGKLFYSNTMEYYDELGSNILDSQITTWDGDADPILDTPLHDLANAVGQQNVIPNGSPLGTSISSGWNASLRIGFGIERNVFSVKNTIGGSFNYSSTNQDTYVSLLDMNGDGLPDKVYRDNSAVSYRPNNGTGFGNAILISDIGGLSITKSRTFGAGADANLLGTLGIGKSWSKTRVETERYFTDFNGDGLPDLVGSGPVKFNITETENNSTNDPNLRTFSSFAQESENEIVSGSVSPELIESIDLETLDELREEFPQFDHVKVWQAPYTGTINIGSIAYLLAKNQNSANTPNSFRITIERGPSNAQNAQQIGASGQLTTVSNTQGTTMNRSGITVTKGEYIFFRVHNLEYGYGGKVAWNPTITYSSINSIAAPVPTDENGISILNYSAQSDFKINNGGEVSFPRDGSSITLNFNLVNQTGAPTPITAVDEIRFIIRKKTTNLTTGETLITPLPTYTRIYRRTSGNTSATFTGSNNTTTLTTLANPNFVDSYYFYAESNGNIDWTQIAWQPTIIKNGATIYPNVSFQPHNENVHQKRYWFNFNTLPYPTINNDESQKIVRIKHDYFTASNLQNLTSNIPLENFPLKINFVIKSVSPTANKIEHSRTLYICKSSENGPITLSSTFNGNSPVIIGSPGTGSYYVREFTKAQVKQLIDVNATIYAAIYVDNSAIAANTNWNMVLEAPAFSGSNYTAPSQTNNAPIFAKSPQFYGNSYRGWGEFLYNGGVKFPRNQEGDITSNTFTNFGAAPLAISTFANASNGTVQDIPADITPDNEAITNTEQTVRYNFYNQNITYGYENSAIKDARYGFENGELVCSVGRFAEKDLYVVYIDPSSLLNGNSGVFPSLKQRSVSKGSAVSGNFAEYSGTASKSSSKITMQYLDLNGDRYPEIVGESKIQYTNMLGGVESSPRVNTDNFVSGDNSTDDTVGVTIAGSQPQSTKSSNGKATGGKTNTNVSSGINVSSGRSDNARMWIDINGDGLTDKVSILENSISVKLNLGYTFSDEIIWGSGYNHLLSSWRANASVGPSVPLSASFSAGIGLSRSKTHMGSTLSDVNGDGLPDLIICTSTALPNPTDTMAPPPSYSYFINNGKSFNSSSLPLITATLDSDQTISGNAFAAGTYGFWIDLAFIAFKVVFTGSLGANGSYNEKLNMLQDIDGDGLVDALSDGGSGNSSINVRKNKLGKTYLLKKVNGPLGGSWSVDYSRSEHSYELPQFKWLMTRVTTHDGFTDDADFNPTTTSIEAVYDNPKNNRRERDFMGYGKVIINHKDTNDNTYRITEQNYYNENYYVSGLLKSTQLLTPNNEMLSKEYTLYNILDAEDPIVNLNADQNATIFPDDLNLDQNRLFVAPVKIISTNYEGGQSITSTKEFQQYDSNGNLLQYRDVGNGGFDSFITNISYFTSVGSLTNSIGYIRSVSVIRASDSQLFRQRSVQYTPKGKITELKIKVNELEFNTTSYSYDNAFGNLVSVFEPDNLNYTEDAFYTKQIVYDETLKMYPTSVSNAFGETSTFDVYDYWFGIPLLSTDKNGQQMRTRIDNRGRIVEVTAPNELALENTTNSAAAWTIRMNYKGEDPIPTNLQGDDYLIPAKGKFVAANPGGTTPITNSQHFAVTRHNDYQINENNQLIPNELLTVTISDGLGRPIQVKKTHFSGNALKWQVSGFAVQDAFGRTTTSFLLTVQNSYPSLPLTGNLSTPHTSYFAQSPSALISTAQNTYDLKDRVLSVQQTGESGMLTNSYSIENGMLKQNTTNELAQTYAVFTDVRGRQRKTVTNNENTVVYNYNAINELITVTDNEGHTTLYEYDAAGRKTQVSHPDRGVTKFRYSTDGDLIATSNAVLEQAGNLEILYKYDFGRLVEIQYPLNPQNNVKYTYGSPDDAGAVAEKAIGRLYKQEDATGVQVFGYGRLGELTKNLRSVAVAGYQSYWFYTKWKYDSWNRIREITYPDQEKVFYKYNNAGALNKITSKLSPGSSVAETDIVTNITYTPYGERATITYGNGTSIQYSYDTHQRRLNTLAQQFANNYTVSKTYSYDALSNITSITTNNATATLPTNGKIGGPVNHTYQYDNFNRLINASGNYIGANDIYNQSSPTFVKQQYDLTMEYNTDHTIKKKTQLHTQGVVTSVTDTSLDNLQPVRKTNYVIDYTKYGSNGIKPHALTRVTEAPGWIPNLTATDPRVLEKRIGYDANGNQVEISEMFGDVATIQRRNIWDEQNRLLAVDLRPEDKTPHPIAIYTYDAAGERIVRYNTDQFEVSTNSSEVAQMTKDNIMIYPSGLLMGRVLRKTTQNQTRLFSLAYSKHYYIGSERITSRTGSNLHIARFPKDQLESDMPDLDITAIREKSNATVALANESVTSIYTKFEQPTPTLQSSVEELFLYADLSQVAPHKYYFHPDHLGSSTYISNDLGQVSQHAEYLPFGELLVDEHKNSNNSPFKFNGKLLDEETGNYYYGARYYDPKWSSFISVDPLAEKYPSISGYAYCANNPVIYIDPDGRDIIGVTSEDAKQFKADVHNVLNDEKFAKVRALIDVKGKTFKHIEQGKLDDALSGVSLSQDEKAYIDLLANTINSDEKHVVEYLETTDIVSSQGSSAVRDHLNSLQADYGNQLIPNSNTSAVIISSLGGEGFNVPTKNGSHSFLIGMKNRTNDERSATSAHEVFGHGIPSSLRLSHSLNNENAIRADNLVRRLLCMPERNGSDHAGYQHGHIKSPYKLPRLK